MYRRIFALSIIWILLLSPAISAFEATVSKVIDGDTIELADGKRVRYLGIDTPEKGESYYNEAKHLNDILVKNQPVYMVFGNHKEDKYNRYLGYVFVNGYFVNGMLVREGLANVYMVDLTNDFGKMLIGLQKQAREEKKGIWSRTFKLETYYVGNKTSRTFHRPDCKLANRIIKQNKVTFQRRDDALDQGYSPGRHCKP
jgi:micrococcal nuclease